MNTQIKLRPGISFLLIIMTVLILGCKDDNTVDPCESTIASTKILYVTADVQVVDQNGAGIANEIVEYKFEQHACNGDITLIAAYTDTTNIDGFVGPETNKMSLYNTEDEILISATAINLVSTKKFANKTYKYNDFDDNDHVTYTLTITQQ